MKLILCTECEDVVRLTFDVRRCGCGAIAGHYLPDGWHARVSDNAVCIGFDNHTLVRGLATLSKMSPISTALGPDVKSWLFPKNYERIERVKRETLK